MEKVGWKAFICLVNYLWNIFSPSFFFSILLTLKLEHLVKWLAIKEIENWRIKFQFGLIVIFGIIKIILKVIIKICRWLFFCRWFKYLELMWKYFFFSSYFISKSMAKINYKTFFIKWKHFLFVNGHYIDLVYTIYSTLLRHNTTMGLE